MPDRIPGCICELDPKTGESVIFGYAMCPIHNPFIMTKWKLFSWDYREHPDWEGINKFTINFETPPIFYDIYSGEDEWWVVVADRPLTKEELDYIKSTQ